MDPLLNTGPFHASHILTEFRIEFRFEIELDWSSPRGKNLLPFTEVCSDFFACRAEPTYA